MNATRWQGLYRMVNENRHLSKIVLSSSEGGEQDMEEEAHEEDGDDEEQEEQEEEDHDNDEVIQDADSDEEDEQANESAKKKFLFAHRLLDEIGFQNNPLLENVLSSANEVSGLVQKQEGMGLSVGYQMAKVLKDEVTSMRLMVVSGTTKDGDWKEAHASTLPSMFKMQRSIFAQDLESRFQVDGTPDKNTMLALSWTRAST